MGMGKQGMDEKGPMLAGPLQEMEILAFNPLQPTGYQVDPSQLTTYGPL